jgi:RNA polymerase sigma-70 factor (ECF subfamily)
LSRAGVIANGQNGNRPGSFQKERGRTALGATDRLDSLEGFHQRLIAIEMDERAFVEFAETLGPVLRSFFLRKGLSVTAAEDLAADLVTDIALKANKYEKRESGSFKAWIFTIARNELVNWARRKLPTEPLANQKRQFSWRATKSATGNPEIQAAIEDAIVRLPPKDQEVITLRYLDGHNSFADIGNILGIAEGSARQRHSRARKRLETLLAGDARLKKFIERQQRSEIKNV